MKKTFYLIFAKILLDLNTWNTDNLLPIKSAESKIITYLLSKQNEIESEISEQHAHTPPPQIKKFNSLFRRSCSAILPLVAVKTKKPPALTHVIGFFL